MNPVLTGKTSKTRSPMKYEERSAAAITRAVASARVVLRDPDKDEGRNDTDDAAEQVFDAAIRKHPKRGQDQGEDGQDRGDVEPLVELVHGVLRCRGGPHRDDAHHRGDRAKRAKDEREEDIAD